MKKYSITFARSTSGDLEEILAWYVEQGVPDVGKRLVSEVIIAVGRLADFPESGRIVSEFEVTWLREIIQPPFRIVYRLDEQRVSVVRVWRSERLLKMPG